MSLAASSVHFDLYSSCPFEGVSFTGPELDVNVGASSLTTPAPAGPSLAPPLPEFCGVISPYSWHPSSSDIRSDYELSQFDDFVSLDATDWLPTGGLSAGIVHHVPSGAFFFAYGSSASRH